MRDVVFRYLLERHARERGDRAFVTFAEEGQAWTWARADLEANRMAAALRSLGISKGDVVGILDDNTPALVRDLIGSWKLGAVASPLNTALRGATLTHALQVAQPKVLLCGPEWVDRLAAHAEHLPRTVVLHAPAPHDLLATVADVHVLDDLLAEATSDPPDDPGIDPWDPYIILFTSGTTGPAKGVLCCYSQAHAQVAWTTAAHCTDDDVMLGDLPLFHVGAYLALVSVLTLGASWVVVPRVRIERYWDIVCEHGVTHATLLPVIMNFLDRRPPRPDDTDNPLRIVLVGRPGPRFGEWRRRFGIDACYSYFNTTEISSPLIRGPESGDRKGNGRPRPGVEVRLVDEHDLEVADGALGELIIRTDQPWEMNLGYLRMPEATLAAWRNGWFHTGDLFVRDPSGEYHYVDRARDSIRRRGENVSSYEVETAVLLHDAVLQCAALGVPDGADGDAVKVCVVLRPGAELDPAQLIEFLRPRLPYFAVPRFVEVLDEMPTTETGRVRKVELRRALLTPATWDREVAGIVVSRHE